MLSRRSFLSASAGTLLAATMPDQDLIRSVPSNLDHILVGTRDLDEGIAFLEKLSGYRASFGGSHPGRGTRNALLKLGHTSYLEILAPDPEQKELVWHKELPSLDRPCLVGWAMRAKHITSATAAGFQKKGIKVIGPIPGSRIRPDGETLRWTLLLREDDREGILPFYIEWDSLSPHPSDDAPGGCLLLDFRTVGQIIEGLPPAPHLLLKQDPKKPVFLQATFAGLSGEFQLTSRSIPSQFWQPDMLR